MQASDTEGDHQDKSYQQAILQKVSRTFALTIPQMPVALVDVVSNAYLLCRIADTIEDEVSLSAQQKLEFSRKFIEVVAGRIPAEEFANELYPLLSDAMLDAERDLVKNSEKIIRITHRFSNQQQAAILHCINTMAQGMSFFQMNKISGGVNDLSQLDQYCYYVAGVVGEMLTELCCFYSADINRNKQQLLSLAVSFGQGLQMTNILKDVWDDFQRGACWLPRNIFNRYGFDLGDMTQSTQHQGFVDGVNELIAIAHGHLTNALQYTLLIPKHEKGIRKFCLWAIGMAMLTLQNIYKQNHYQHGANVKISRKSVRWVILLTQFTVKHNWILSKLFQFLGQPLPKALFMQYTEEQLKAWQGICIKNSNVGNVAKTV